MKNYLYILGVVASVNAFAANTVLGKSTFVNSSNIAITASTNSYTGIVCNGYTSTVPSQTIPVQPNSSIEVITSFDSSSCTSSQSMVNK